MKDDRPYIKAGPKQRLQHSNDPRGARRKKEKRKTEDYTLRRTVEKERKELDWESWNEARTIAADRERRKCSVEALWATRHEADR